MSLRLLLVAHGFPPRATAGVEVYTSRLARALRERGHVVQVLCAVHDLGAASGTVRRRVQDGTDVVEIVNVYERGTLKATYAHPEIDAAAARVVREFRPHCVHVQHLINLSTGVLRSASEMRAGVLMTLHDYWLSCPRDGLRMREDATLCAQMDHQVCATCLKESPYLTPSVQRGVAKGLRGLGMGGLLHLAHDHAPALTTTVLRWLRVVGSPSRTLAEGMDRRASHLREVLNVVDVFIAPTSFARARAVEFGVPADRIRVASLGAVRPGGASRDGNGGKRFGYIGTLAPHKGVHVLIEAFGRLRQADVSLDVYGNPDVYPRYADRLRTLAARDARIRFRGAFREGEQWFVLGRLDAVVVPSLWWENSPLVAQEAVAAGVPVIASRTGGIPEMVVEHRDGLLVPPNDVGALSEALETFVGGRLNLRPQLVPSMTLDEGTRALEEIYREVCGRHREAEVASATPVNA